MRFPFSSRLVAAAMMCGLQAGSGFAAESSGAPAGKPAAREIAALRDCATRNGDNLDEGERQCLFNLVAEPCINKRSAEANTAVVADCYRLEGLIWDGLLNENYKSLLDTLDDGQAVKARAMQRAWQAYRDTTCQFYDDKIQGSMAITMHAACVTRESARRAMLLKFFSRL
jgi:uncharacterized protein YecT (DUF1311 family)